MTSWLVVVRSLLFYRRTHLAVALGVAAATAVLTGALVVGDSVRHSLRTLALGRLGAIDQLLVADHFFREGLAGELQAETSFQQAYQVATPAIAFPTATAERTSNGGGRASQVFVLGVQDDFWKLTGAGPKPKRPPNSDEVVLNATLARDLNASVGDLLVLRFPKVAGVPEDSALGRTEDRLVALPELKVVEILPDEGLGRFSLQPSQLLPRNAFVGLAAVQSALAEPGKVNALFVGDAQHGVSVEQAEKQLAAAFHPHLEDYGLHLRRSRRTFGDGADQQTIYDYFSLSSDRLLLSKAEVAEAEKAFTAQHPAPALTYLANKIEKIGATSEPTGGEKAQKSIPYSTVAAVGDLPRDASNRNAAPQALADDELALNAWAAEDQKLALGDRVRVTFFEPETIHGAEKEVSADFRVAAILPLTEPSVPYGRRGEPEFSERPTPANDPDYTPEVKGITDKSSMQDWDAPFPFDYGLLRPQDDVYWDNHRTTPKAFISFNKGKQLWGSRFGDVTTLRLQLPPGAASVSDLSEQAVDEQTGKLRNQLEQRFLAQLAADHETLGFDFIPIRARTLAAARGTTPFDVLFLLLSMFVIGAAMLLVWLLFRLGVDQRASEIGLLVAQGWPRRRVGWLMLREGLIVAALGAAIGVLAGIGYAWLMIVGLTTWWVEAIATPFLKLHVSPLSLAIGYGSGLILCGLTIWFSLRALRKPSVRQLLAGETTAAPAVVNAGGSCKRSWNLAPILIVALYTIAILLSVAALRLSAEAQAGAFLAAGAAVLTATLMVVYRRLKAGGQQGSGIAEGGLPKLAQRSAARNVGRSVATIALVASATFLIVAVSSFRLAPTDSGTGGFVLLGETSQPIFSDLNTDAGRSVAFGERAKELSDATIYSLRLRGGDDASCRNLYQPAEPRVLGVTTQFVNHFDDPQATHFRFAASAARGAEQEANPWLLLVQTAEPKTASEPTPVVLDQNTAMYSLKLYGGVGETFTIDYDDRPVNFRVVGLLANSVLQGNLLIGEKDFERVFSGISGYKYFLIDAPTAQAPQVAEALEANLSDEGFDAVDARRRLSELLAVQNTYISTFQSLGALGLLLGTFGLAAVQLRSVFERRKELALMRAAGFARSRLGQLVMLENLFLLLGGLLTGVFAAAITVLPHWLVGGASAPVVSLAVMLGVVFVVGILTGLFAVRATLNAPLVSALRGE